MFIVEKEIMYRSHTSMATTDSHQTLTNAKGGTWISNAMTSGELKPLLKNLAAPFRTINIRPLD